MFDLIAALKVIRDECGSHEDCAVCPLRSADNASCMIPTDIPADWKLSVDNYVVPRVFK